MSKDFKKKVYRVCLANLHGRLDDLKEELKKMSDASGEETKSSMGDKYETSREMMQQERNKIGGQIEILSRELVLLQRLNMDNKLEKVSPGSLIETNKACFFICAPIGALKVDDLTVFVLSEKAPIARLMLSKEKGDHFEFNGRMHEIISIQ